MGERIMILGGTFNPIHNGHLKLAREIEWQFSPCKVVFIPTGIPPHKEIKEQGVTGQDRLAMTKEAVKPFRNYLVSDMELKRQGKSYTVDTLRQLQQEHPGAQLHLVVGTDMLLTFEQWRDYRTIFELCTVVAAYREKKHRKALMEAAQRFEKIYGANIRVIEMEPVEISSTVIREMVKRGEDISPYVPYGVEQYIKAHGLYGQTK